MERDVPLLLPLSNNSDKTLSNLTLIQAFSNSRLQRQISPPKETIKSWGKELGVQISGHIWDVYIPYAFFLSCHHSVIILPLAPWHVACPAVWGWLEVSCWFDSVSWPQAWHSWDTEHIKDASKTISCLYGLITMKTVPLQLWKTPETPSVWHCLNDPPETGLLWKASCITLKRPALGWTSYV